MKKFVAPLLIAVLFASPFSGVQAKSAVVSVLVQANTSSAAFVYRQQGAKVSSRKQATAMVKARFSGKILSVNAIELNGNKGYQAKLLSNDGTVYYVFVDAKTGKMRRR